MTPKTEKKEQASEIIQTKLQTLIKFIEIFVEFKFQPCLFYISAEERHCLLSSTE